MDSAEKELFERAPVLKAIASLAVPTVISQIIAVVYNLADAYFIGQMNDPAQVASTAVALPLFIFTTGLSSLFGVGGASFISRALGAGNARKASQGSSFCIYGTVIASFLFGMSVLQLRPVLLPLLGATDMTYSYCSGYVFWTMGVGSVPIVLNMCLSHLVRAEGHSRQAGFGMAFGGVLNILLDPVFIFVFGLGVRGAAMATSLSGTMATAYYLLFIFRMRGRSALSISPRDFAVRGIAWEVLSVGLPSFISSLMSSFSNGTLNKILSGYSSEAVAGMGITKKVHNLAVALAHGMTQGPLPLIGYNYASGNRERMGRSIKTLFVLCMSIGIGEILLLHASAWRITSAFIENEETVRNGATFLRIICLDCPTTMLSFLIISLFQATGAKIRPLALSFLRKGTIDVPFMFLFNSLFGLAGVAWATPCADVTALAISLAVFIPYFRTVSRQGWR